MYKQKYYLLQLLKVVSKDDCSQSNSVWIDVFGLNLPLLPDIMSLYTSDS